MTETVSQPVGHIQTGHASPLCLFNPAVVLHDQNILYMMLLVIRSRLVGTYK
jgi:hypothetical protein